jgi:hypothetical protein
VKRCDFCFAPPPSSSICLWRRAAGGFGLPENGGQPDEQREIGDVVDERVGHHFRARAALLGDEEGEDEIPDAGTIRHDERAQHRALEPVRAHRFQPPDHSSEHREPGAVRSGESILSRRAE